MSRNAQTAALALSLAWMALALVAAALACEMGLATRFAAVVQWLLAGVLPPALALATMPAERR